MDTTDNEGMVLERVMLPVLVAVAPSESVAVAVQRISSPGWASADDKEREDAVESVLPCVTFVHKNVSAGVSSGSEIVGRQVIVEWLYALLGSMRTAVTTGAVFWIMMLSWAFAPSEYPSLAHASNVHSSPLDVALEGMLVLLWLVTILFRYH